MVEKMPFDQAMRFAGITAALKCLTFGGSQGVPDRAAVNRML
jgi:sugar/nucleoside kinase (ribokinase family)